MSGAMAQRHEEGSESSQHQALQAQEVRARLRAALMERILQGMEDVRERLAEFLKSPNRLGAVNLSLVLSESAITHEVWEEPSVVPERRARMAWTLGLPAAVDDASLLRALMAEVHQAFVDFQASPSGREARRRYEELLTACEAANVLPVIPAHDTGPMLGELTRLGLPHENAFTRSLLVDPLILSVGLTPEDCSASPLMIAGQSLSDLGAIVAYLRSLNPRLSNRQVRKILLRASTTEGEDARRTSLGQSEVERVIEFARQLLRFQVAQLLFV